MSHATERINIGPDTKVQVSGKVVLSMRRHVLEGILGSWTVAEGGVPASGPIQWPGGKVTVFVNGAPSQTFDIQVAPMPVFVGDVFDINATAWINLGLNLSIPGMGIGIPWVWQSIPDDVLPFFRVINTTASGKLDFAAYIWISK